MRRKATVPYGETSILSLANITAGTKFQFIAKIIDISQTVITVSDDHEKMDFTVSEEELADLDVGEIIIVFGEKTETGIQKDQILKLNLDWGLYVKTRDLESKLRTIAS